MTFELYDEVETKLTSLECGALAELVSRDPAEEIYLFNLFTYKILPSITTPEEHALLSPSP